MFNCSKCNKNQNKNFSKDLIKIFANAYEFCDEDINKFIFLLRKGIYAYQ